MALRPSKNSLSVKDSSGGTQQGFPRAIRLLKRAEYESVYGAGQRRSSPQFSIFFRARSGPANETMEEEATREASSTTAWVRGVGSSRFGISVKKALGGAVVRNRIRRRIREILRRNRTEIPAGWDIVIHPKATVARAEFAPLEAELVRLLRSLPLPGSPGARQAGPQNSGAKP